MHHQLPYPRPTSPTPLPLHLLQAIFPTLLPALTHIIKSSLHTGIFTTAFKQAGGTPLFNKTILNTKLADLPFISYHSL